jgi:gliding motility-associated-like protein
MKCSKSTLLKVLFFFIMMLIYPSTSVLFAQIALGNPNVSASSLCANPGFNKFTVDISFNSAALQASNQFSIELSDALGSFSSPTTIFTSAAGAITTSPATLSFAIPITTNGEKYQLRIKTTAPMAQSNASKIFPAYYKSHDTFFTINNFKSTASYCNGSSFVLRIDPESTTNNSPLKFPNLTYNWYKEITSTSSVLVGTGIVYNTTAPGVYFVETNYGSCSPSGSYSNRVKVSEAVSGSTVAITSSLGNPFCPSVGSTTLTTTVTGNTYQWYKDDKIITGATNQQYIATTSGLYSVNIDFGGCISTPTLDLKALKINSSLNVPDLSIIKQGETKKIIVTTDASTPSFEWFLNDITIPGASTNSYDVTAEGKYKVKVIQNTTCKISTDILFEIKYRYIDPNLVLIPNLISPNGDGVNDTWILPHEYVEGTNTQIIIYSSQGKIVFETKDYQNNWPDVALDFISINPVYYFIITTQDNQIKKGSITVVN